MYRIVFFSLSLFFTSHCVHAHVEAADEGQSVIDEALFNAIRERYDGSWRTEVHGQAKAETLRDGSILVEVDGRMAEFFFYKLNDASEDILYIPSVSNEWYSSRWLNYFDRVSDGIACGLSSDDLKKDPFPYFKCRFRIDSDGILHSFLDRDANSSMATPPSYDGQWEGGQFDFHWRPLNEHESKANAYSSNLGDTAGFDFQIYGAIAYHLYQVLNVREQDEHWGPFPVKMKIGRQIWCADTTSIAEVPSNDPSGYKCRIGFESNGRAYQDHQSEE